MLLSKKVIKSFIEGIESVSDADIVTTLNAIGAEVENVHRFPQTDDYVIIGQITDVKPHPYAENQAICRVRVSEQQIAEIVCGGKNVLNNPAAVGKYAIVALTGTELPNGKEIASKSIHGVISNGMLCGYDEINPKQKKFMSESDADTVVLLNHARLFDRGIAKYLSTDDVVFDISVPTNRPDWQGARFICREIAASLGLKFKDRMKNYAVRTSKFNHPFKTLNYAPSLCNYYDVIHLRSKRVEQSTWDLKGILMNHQIKPANDLVDNCTLISLLTGNPINVYDAGKIDDHLVLKTASRKETLTAADGRRYEIEPGDLIVCDRSKTVSLAGVAVSAAAMVDENTTAYLIEIANYKKNQMAETVDRIPQPPLGAKMFCRQISMYATKLTIDHVYRYLLKHNLAQQISELNSKCHVDEYCRKIPINFDQVRALIGADKKALSDAKIEKQLRAIGFGLNGSMVLVPSYRSDIWNWQDLAEEVVKMVDVNALPERPIAIDYTQEFEANADYEMVAKLYRRLIALQISNVKTYNLTTLEDATMFDFFNRKTPLRVLRPNSAGREYFRINVISNLLKVLDYNKKRKNRLRPVFELQNILTQTGSEHHIGIALPTRLFEDNCGQGGVEKNLLTMKGLSDIIVDNFGFRCAYEKIDASEYLVASDSLQLVVYNQIIGYIGRVRPSVLRAYDLSDLPVYVLDINLEKLITSLNRIPRDYEPYSRLQNVDRDITFTLGENQSFDAFVKAIANVPEISRWELISVYEKQPEGPTEPRHEAVQLFETPTIDLSDAAAPKPPTAPKPPVSYCVRYYIEQIKTTLSAHEINEITDSLVEQCEASGIAVRK